MNRVLVHVDTTTAVDRRLAYVAVSRGRTDVQLYSNDRHGSERRYLGTEDRQSLSASKPRRRQLWTVGTPSAQK